MAVEPMRRKRVSNGMGNGGNSDHERRITALEAKVTVVQTTLVTLTEKVDAAATNTADILAMMQHAKTVGGFVRKHGPRVLAAVVGYAIATGRMSAETGQSFLHLFGL